MTSRYEQRGVSSDKQDVHKAIEHIEKGLYPNAFCKIIPDHLTGDKEYCLVMHADGAGTKSSLAYAYYKHLKETITDKEEFEQKSKEIWRNISMDSIVMNLDDLTCVGAVGSEQCPFLLSSTINRNKNLVPGEVISHLINGTEDIIQMLKEYGVNVVSTGGETADMPDLVRTVCVDSCMVARMKREDVIDMSNVSAGDVIIGLSSFGQCKYESRYNSGVGSNGLTSVRHDMFGKSLKEKYPECCDPSLPKEVCFTGKFGISDKVIVENEEMNVAELVLSPTRTYAPIIKMLLLKMSKTQSHDKIHGIIHCSGGAQTKILHFVNHDKTKKQIQVVKDSLFPEPPLFEMIHEQSGTDWKEMYKVFNMGHRMEIYCHPDIVSDVIGVSKNFGVDAKVIGSIRAKQEGEPDLVIDSPHGRFEYSNHPHP